MVGETPPFANVKLILDESLKTLGSVCGQDGKLPEGGMSGYFVSGYASKVATLGITY